MATFVLVFLFFISGRRRKKRNSKATTQRHKKENLIPPKSCWLFDTRRRTKNQKKTHPALKFLPSPSSTLTSSTHTQVYIWRDFLGCVCACAVEKRRNYQELTLKKNTETREKKNTAELFLSSFLGYQSKIHCTFIHRVNGVNVSTSFGPDWKSIDLLSKRRHFVS